MEMEICSPAIRLLGNGHPFLVETQAEGRILAIHSRPGTSASI